MTTATEGDHILALSQELLDDIELGRLSSDRLLLKATRLARLSGSEEIREWLGYEMLGYNAQAPVSLLYMTRTGRWTNYEEKKGYYGPLAGQEHNIQSLEARLEAAKITNIEGDWAFRVSNDNRKERAELSNQLVRVGAIRSRVIGLIHSFVAGVFYERQFADVAIGTFEQYKFSVDALIADKAGTVLEKIPSVISRLKEGEGEAVSQALTTCRRIIEALADAIFPPAEGSYEINGNKLSLDASKHQNRLNVYIAQRTNSASRRTRLRQNLANLFDRISTGVHNDVTTDEAFSLFLNVYLFLGEILQLPDIPQAAQAEEV